MKKLACSLLTIIILFTISCEIGLGSSVDTEPPSLEISADIVDTTIAGDFNIEGTYSDDGNIAGISAVLKRTDGFGSDIQITGTLEENLKKRGTGTWKIPVNAKTDNIIDGPYQITVSIKDAMGRITTQSTTFTIDNTPPVLILTKPNSKPGDDTVSAYGQRIFLEGSIADSAKETKITVEFYDNENCEGDALATIPTGAISPTDVNSNNARLAVYADTDDLEKLYNKIYNPVEENGKEGSKDIYIRITASDIAGNETTDFYFSKDLGENLTKDKKSNGYGLAPIDIYTILNGTDNLKNSARSTTDVTTIKSLLAESKKEIAMFSLNPANSPYFTIAGMKTITGDKDFESSDKGYFVINGAQTLEISVFMGSDSIELVDDKPNTPVDEREFYAYVLECEENGTPKLDATPIKLYSKSKETGTGSEKKTYYSIGGKQGHKTTSGAYVFTIPMAESIIPDLDIIEPETGIAKEVETGLEVGKNYRIFVHGKDNEDNEIESYETGYGFHFSSGGGAPTLEIEEPSDTTAIYKKGSKVKFKGTVKSGEGIPEVTLWKSEKGKDDVKIDAIPLLTEYAGKENAFEYEIPAEKFNQDESGIYSIKIMASRGEGVTTLPYSIWYDVKGPAITINSKQPVVTVKKADNTSEECINGIFTVKGTIIDDIDQVETAVWKVKQGDGVISGIGGEITNSFDFSVNTNLKNEAGESLITDNENVTIIIEATDRAGNVNTESLTYKVDQSTDKPAITNSSDALDITKGTNESIFDQSMNMFVRGSSLVLGVSDDDGVKEAEVILQLKDSTGKFAAINKSEDSETYSKWTNPSVITHTIPTEVGVYKVTVIAKDKYFDTTATTPYNYTEVTFMIKVTGTGPDVTITPEKDYVSTLNSAATNKLTFKVNGATATDKFKLSKLINGQFVIQKTSDNKEERTSPFDYILDFNQGTTPSDEITFRITDANGFTNKVFTPKFDNDLPSVSINEFPALIEDTYLFKGTMSDETSGIDSVKIKISDGAWVDCTCGSSTWNYEAVFTSEGTKTITVKAIDEAGNEYTAPQQSFIYDTSKPNLTVANLTEGKTNILSDEVTNSGYTLSGTVSDSNALAETNALVVIVDGVQTVVTPTSDGNWSLEIAKGTAAGKLKSDASVNVEVIAKDVADKTTSKSFIIYYDTKNPELEVTSPAEDEPVETAEKAIKGTVRDDGYGVDKVEYTLYKGNVTATTDNPEVIQANGTAVTSENFPVTLKGEQWYIADTVNGGKIPLGELQGPLTLKVTATEKKNGTHGGRTTTTYVRFYYDVANPSLKETEIGTTGKTTNVGFKFEGKVWDSNAVGEIEIKCDTDNKSWISGTTTGPNITLTPATSEPEENNWTATFVVGSANSSAANYMEDGTHELKVIARDISGKETQLTRVVTVDTVNPQVSGITVTTDSQFANGSVSWYDTRTLSVEVTVTDTGSGISKVEYTTGTGSNATWAPLSSRDGKYVGAITFANDGANQKIRVKATDVAGNVSSIFEETVSIDTTAPELNAMLYKKGTNGSITTIGGTVCIQNNTSLTFYGNYTDPQSGVYPLTFKFNDDEIESTSINVTYSTTAINGSNASAVDTLSYVAYDAQTVTAPTTYKSWKAVFTPTASGSLSVSGSNRADNPTSEIKILDITCDTEAPVFSNEKLEEMTGTTASTKKEVYYKSSNSKYYTNNSGKTYVLSGVAADDVGIESVTLQVVNTATTNPATALTPDMATGATLSKWKFEFPLTDWQTGATATVTVTDKAGRSTNSIYNIVFDTEAPSAKHAVDAKGKDLYFRIGNYDNDDISTSNSIWSNTLDKDSGAKYAGGTYGNAYTINIRGTFEDGEGSDVKKIWYKVYKTGNEILFANSGNEYNLNETQLNNLIADVVAGGKSFAPLSSVESKRVFYNVSKEAGAENYGGTLLGNATDYASASYYKYYKVIDSNYNVSLSDFTEGINYLVLVVEDNAGNRRIDSATVPILNETTNETENRTFPCFSLNVDTNPPTITPPSDMSISYTNGGSKIMGVTVQDLPKSGATETSGVASVKFTYEDNGTKTVNAVYNSESEKYEADIGNELVNKTSGTFTISAVATDKAGTGNTSTLIVGTIMIDKEGPQLRINSPAAGASVGTTLTISGTASDGNGAGLSTKTSDKITLYATKTANLSTEGNFSNSTDDIATKWVKLGEVATAAEWVFTGVDISDLGITDGENTPFYFMVSGKDDAGTGNLGYSPTRNVIVDRKLPVIQEEPEFTANGNEAWINSNTITLAGSFTDPATDTGTTVIPGSGVNTIYYLVGDDINNKVGIPTTDGTFNTNISLGASGEGVHLHIWAKDKAGNTLTALPSANTANYKMYTFKVDSNPPTIESKYFQKGSEAKASVDGTVYIKSQTDGTDFVLYGNYADGNTESGVTALTIKNGTTTIPASSITYSTAVLPETAGGTFGSYGEYDASKAGIYKSWKAEFNVNASGRITVEGGDKAGNRTTTITALDIAVDNTVPVVSNVNFTETTGTVTKDVYSTTVDSNVTYFTNNTVSGRTFAISGIATDNVGLQKVSLNIANTATTNTAVPLTYVDNNPTGNWSFTIGDWSGWSTGATATVTVTDKAGNESTASLNIQFDTTAPSLDNTKFKTPTPTETESNLFKFEGLTNSVVHAETGSGFDKVDIAFTSINEEPSAAQTTANIASDGSWSSTIEFANISTFNTEGTKYLWVRAYDKAGNVSDEWSPKSFIYDTAAPNINFTSTTPDANSYKNVGFTIEVETPDTNDVATVTASYGSQTNVPLTLTSGKWAKEFVVGSSNSSETNYLADAAYNFTVTVTDTAGKTKSVTRTITVDTTNPTGTFGTTTPAGNLVSTNRWYKVSSIRFAFNVDTTEANIATVEISKDASTYEAMNVSNGSYVANVTGLSEGSNTVTVKMTDLAGNENTVSQTVYVDTTDPTLTPTESSILKYMGTGGFTVSGTASDNSSGSGIDTLTVKQEYNSGSSWDAPETENITINGNNWSKSLPIGTLADNGQYRYTFTLKDKAGNEKSYQFTTTVDQTAPTLSITNPTNKTGTGAINVSSYMFTGSIDEANEIKAIYYQILSDTATAPTAPASNVINTSSWSGWTAVTPEANWSFYRDIKTGTNPIAEGKYKIYMYALDGAGNLSERASQEFHVDMAAPVVTESIVTPYIKKTSTDNGKVSLGGSITETHGVKNFKITRGETEYEIVKDGSVQTVPDGSTYSWSYTSSTSGITWFLNEYPGNGTYAYTIEAEDLVGKKTTIEKNVTVDITDPAISTLKIYNVAVAPDANMSNTWYKSQIIPLSVAVTEAESGVASVEWATQTSAQTAALTTSDWTALTTIDDDGNYTGSAIFDTIGTGQKLYIRVTDKAGNVSYFKDNNAAVTINIDTTAPDVTPPENTSFATNGTGDDITVTGTASDAESGLYNIVVTVGGTDFSQTITAFTGSGTEKSWTATIPANSFGNNTTGDFTIYAKATNKAGLASSRISVGTINVDTASPTITITSPVVDAKVAGTFAISGTATDGAGSGLSNDENDKIILYYTKSTTLGTVATAPTSVTAGSDITSSWVVLDNTLSTSSAWEKSNTISTDVAANGANTDVYVMASVKDNAGNTGYSLPRKVTVDRKMPEVGNQPSGFGDGSAWVNRSTITFAGSFTDAGGTGANTIYYLIGDVIGEVDGVNHQPKTIPTTNGSYDTNITVDTNGENVHVHIWAEDKAGNNFINTITANDAGVKTLPTTGDDYDEYINFHRMYTVKLDASAPTIESKYFQKGENGALTATSDSAYVTDNTTITLYGNYEDGANESGVDELTFKNNGTAFASNAITVTYSTTEITDTASITGATFAAYAVANKTAYKSWKAVFSVNGSNNRISAEGKDIAGNPVTETVLDIKVDTAAPVVTITSPTDDTTKTGYDSLTIGGNVTDGTGSGLSNDDIKVYYTKDSTEGSATSITTLDTSKWTHFGTMSSAAAWTFTNANIDITYPGTIASDAANTDLYFTVEAKDKAGNIGYSAPRKITVDRKAPTFVSGTVGGNASGWFNNRTVNINGSFTDDGAIGSGVSYIKYEYQIGSETISNSLPTTDGSYNTNITLNNNVTSTTLKIWAIDAAGNEIPSTDTTNYKTYTLNLDTNEPRVEEWVAGDRTEGYFNNSTLTNRSASETFYFYVTDVFGESGIDTDDPAISVKVGSRTITFGEHGSSIDLGDVEPGTAATANAAGTPNKWPVTIVIGQEDIATLTGNNTVLVTATDQAGNIGLATSVGSLSVDITPPSITVNDLEDKNTSESEIYINGKVSISGSISEINLYEENEDEQTMKLYYTRAASLSATAENIGTTPDSKWVEIGTAAHGNTWTFTDVNTTTLEKTYGANEAHRTTVYFMVSANDKAGNTGYSTPKTVIIDQDTDRPVISLSQIERKTDTVETTLKTNNVYGSITDDDGNVNKLWYKFGTAPTSLPTLSGTTWTATGWTEIPVNGSSWSIESDENDGETTWYFAVADANNKVFATYGTNKFAQPYIKYSKYNNETNKYEIDTDKYDGDATGIKFKYDTTPPSATNLGLYRAPTGTTTSVEDIATNTSITWSTDNNIAFGGNYNVLYAKIEVDESTGMKALTGSGTTAPTSTPITVKYTDEADVNLGFNQIKQVTGNNGKYTYYIGPITMTGTLQHDFKVTVTDAVGGNGYISRSIIVDNTAPTSISKVKPEKTEAVSGTVNFRGNVDDNANGSGILYETDEAGNVTSYGVQYYIPKYSERNSAPLTITTGWSEPTTKGSSSWEIEFTNLGEKIGYNSETYAVSSDYADYETGDDTGLYDIPVWFRLTDAVGNVGYNKDNSIRYNPNADRPTVQITYPTHEAGLNYITMGGTISISGQANDDDGISAVYLQFDMNGDGEYENGVGITGTPFTSNDIKAIPNTNPVEYGILASGTKSWYKTFSIGQLTGLNHGTDNKTLNVRAKAIEKDSEKAATAYLTSSWSDVLHISVNNTVPNFSGIKLKRYTTAPTAATLTTATPIAEQNYVQDMYINGNEEDWYLCGTVESASQKITEISVESGTIDDDDIIMKKSTDEKKADFAIPVGVSETEWDITIRAYDDTNPTPLSSPYSATIKVDKDAPTFVGSLYKNSYGSAENELNSEQYVENRNGWFTLTGKIDEAGSGYKRVVFYFKRTGSGTDTSDRVYNPMETHGADNSENRTNIETTATNGKLYINAEDLPVLYVSDATRKDEGSITLASLKNKKNIRRGGLIKIGGVYRLITDVDNRDSEGTVAFTPGCSIDYKTAEFVYGMVVDHSGESQNADGSVKNDDDYPDGMVESYAKSGNAYTWDATINSKNIPDGPIEIHYVAFDAAGNSRHGYTTTKVSNNPPRITSVKLGTDLNADGTYALDKEFTTFYYSENNDTTVGTAVWNLDAKLDSTTWWTAKKDLVVIPEFVGGTGTIYYNYSKSYGDSPTGLTAAASGTLTGTATLQALSASNSNIKTSGSASETSGATITASQTDNKTGAIILVNDETTDGLGKIGTTNGDHQINIYRFSFWDSTEGCTVGSTSQWTVLNAKFKQDLVDTTKPVGEIIPFYWESKTNNSVVWTTPVAQGHIELENDLPTTTFKDTNKASSTATAPSGEYDRDPKVSGKIKVEGYAYDDTRLGSITVTFANKSATANYSPTNGWTYTNSTAGEYELSVEAGEGPTQSGHKVRWSLKVNTATVDTSAVAAVDKEIKVTVKDAKSGTANSNVTSSVSTGKTTVSKAWSVAKAESCATSRYYTDAALTTLATNSTADDATVYYNKTPYYKVDIVPYITGISTTNRTKSGLKDNNIRSASGKYSIMYAKNTSATSYAANFITVKGFNLKPTSSTSASDVRIVNSDDVKLSSITTSTGTMVRTETATSPYTSFTMRNTIGKSGYLEVFTNGIRSLNNINNNNAHDGNGAGSTIGNTVNDYKNYYNREADYNTTKNVQLTDDRYLTMWDMHKTNTKNGYYPVMIMEGNNPVFGYVDANGASSSVVTTGYESYYMPQRRKFNSDGTVSSTEYLVGGTTWEQMAMTKDSKNKYIQASVYNRESGSMGVYYDKYASYYWSDGKDGWQNPGTSFGQSRDLSSSDSNNALSIEGMRYGGLLIDRYQNLKLNVNGDTTSSSGAIISMAYFDDYYGSIIYRNFKIGTSTSAGSKTMYKDGNTQYYTNQEEISNNSNSATGRNTVTSAGSKYYDFAVTSDKIPVFVYYDFTEGRLRLMYSATATTVNSAAKAIDGNPSTTVQFCENTNIQLPNYVGQYVSMTIDSSGGIHISAFDANDSDLKYIYLTSYSATSYTEMTVDAAGSVGNWTNIKIDGTSSHPYYNKPVIAYYNATETGGRDAIKLAIANNAVGNISAGVDSETNYTSTGWEYMTVPSVDPAQGGNQKFQQVCLDFDSSGYPVVGYLGTNLEFGKALGEE